jgi:hypothetical protein
VLAVKHEAPAALELDPQHDGACPKLVGAAPGEGREGEAETHLQLGDGFQTAWNAP